MNTYYSTDELHLLLHKFRTRNLSHNITGLMLYCDTNVIQYIEGPTPDVTQLYHNILQDSDHKNIITLLHKPLDSRKFTHWDMGYKYISTQHFLNFVSSSINHINDQYIIDLFDSFITVNLPQ